MTRKTLSQSVAEILNESSASAMPTIDKGEVRDLGGSSGKKPEGDAVGKNAADNATKMAAPQETKTGTGATLGAQATALPVGKDGPPNSVKAKVQPPLATPSGGNENTDKAPIMQKTEEVAGEEEVIEETPQTEAEIAEEKAARAAAIREALKSVSIEDDMAALFAGSDLSEEFKTKAKTIFETAVIAKSVNVIEIMEQNILAAAEASVEEVRSDLEGKVDSYLAYMAEEWMKTNEVAVEAGLKEEIRNDFIAGLRSLFIENNMDIPTEEVSVVETLVAKTDELQNQINDLLNKNVELSKKVNESKKVELLNTACEGLTATQVEKIKTLAEGVEFTTEVEYKEKLSIIREQYFSGAVKTVVASTIAALEKEQAPSVVTEELPPDMAAYVAAIGRSTVK